MKDQLEANHHHHLERIQQEHEVQIHAKLAFISDLESQITLLKENTIKQIELLHKVYIDYL